MQLKHILPVIWLAGGLVAHAEWHEPYSGSRMFWDVGTTKTVFESGTYARIIELQDGRLLAVAEGGGVKISFSDDAGQSWDTPRTIVSNPAQVNLAVPDLAQLSDGTILIGYNPRPSEPYSPERRYGMRVVRSTDNGKTWSDEIFIFDASHEGSEGCWEPSFLELPSGEVQCYFANEYDYPESNEQCISMCRSYDKGLTWGKPETVSFRAGSRDGMPVPVILADGKTIAVAIEDNGWPGHNSFVTTIVRSTVDENWSNAPVLADSKDRNMIFAEEPAAALVSAAPYLRVLKTGETIASFQGNYDRSYAQNQNQYDMFVAIGDKDGRNFKGISAPFSVKSNEHSMWNSLSVLGTGEVVAVGSYGLTNGGNAVKIIKGWPMSRIEAAYSDNITVDGERDAEESWTAQYAAQIAMGNVSKTRSTHDFAYDEENLYFTALVQDKTRASNDGVLLYLDADGVSDTKQVKGTYYFLFKADGKILARQGDNGRWTAFANQADIRYAVKDEDNRYRIEVAIPWKALGKTSAPVGRRMAAAIEVWEHQNGTLFKETMTDVKANASWSWMELQLDEHSGSGVPSIASDAEDLKVVVEGDELKIECDGTVARATLYSFDGRALAEAGAAMHGLVRLPLPSQRGGGVLSVLLGDGRTVCKKIMF